MKDWDKEDDNKNRKKKTGLQDYELGNDITDDDDDDDGSSSE